MSEPFLGEIKVVSFNFPPRGWAFCNGQLMPINQNQALFSILGTTYGGDGRVTFGLPNLQGRVPVHVGNGIVLGQMGGEAAHTLTTNELPAHTHTPAAVSTNAVTTSPSGNLWAAAAANPFSTGAANSTMAPGSVTNAGGSQPHNNEPPYLVLNFVIALQGIFPSQS